MVVVEMEKPPIPISSSLSGPAGGGGGSRQKKKLPTARELVAHYESQGVEKEEASLKVIDDLQNALYRVITSGSGRGKKDNFMSDSSRKLDAVSARLSVIEYKLDSKPSYPQSFAVGVASGAALSGLGSLLPLVFGGLNQIWTAVQSTTKTSSP